MAVRRRIGEALSGFAESFLPAWQYQQYLDRLGRTEERAEESAAEQRFMRALAETGRRIPELTASGATPEQWETASDQIQDMFNVLPEQQEMLSGRIMAAMPSMSKRGLEAAEALGPGLVDVSPARRDQALEQMGAQPTYAGFDPAPLLDLPLEVREGLPVTGEYQFDQYHPEAVKSFETAQQEAVSLQEAVENRARREMADRLMLQGQTGIVNLVLPDETAISVILKPNPDDPQAGAIIENVVPYRPGLGTSPFPTGQRDMSAFMPFLGDVDVDENMLSMMAALQRAPGYTQPAWTGDTPFELQFERGIGTTFPEFLGQFELPSPEAAAPSVGVEEGILGLPEDTGPIPFGDTQDPETGEWTFRSFVGAVPMGDGTSGLFKLPESNPFDFDWPAGKLNWFHRNNSPVNEEELRFIDSAAVSYGLQFWRGRESEADAAFNLDREAGAPAKIIEGHLEDLSEAQSHIATLERHAAGLGISAPPDAAGLGIPAPPERSPETGGFNTLQPEDMPPTLTATPPTLAPLFGAPVPIPGAAGPFTAPMLPPTFGAPVPIPGAGGPVTAPTLPPGFGAPVPIPGMRPPGTAATLPPLFGEPVPIPGARPPVTPTDIRRRGAPPEPRRYPPPLAPPTRAEVEPLPAWGDEHVPTAVFDEYAPYVAAASQKHKVPQELIWSVMKRENQGFDPGAVGKQSGELGLMQLTPNPQFMAEEFGMIDADADDIWRTLTDPGQNIDMGTQYLKKLYKLFQGNWELAVAAYNSGMGRVWETDTTWYEKYPGGGTPAQRRDDPGIFTVPAPSAGYVDEVFERSPQLTALLPPRKRAN